jgi:hypothetical protein
MTRLSGIRGQFQPAASELFRLPRTFLKTKTIMNRFFGAFAKLEEATISFLLSIRSVIVACISATRRKNDFHEVWYWYFYYNLAAHCNFC